MNLKKDCLESLEGRVLGAQQGEHCECPECAAATAELLKLRDAVLAEDDAIDDLARARVMQKLSPVIDDALSARKPRSAQRRWLAPLSAAALLLVGLGLGLLLAGTRRPAAVPHRAERPTEILVPYRIQGQAPELRERLGRRVDRLVVPEGVEARALLGCDARLALVGPAELSVQRASRGRIAVELKRGTVIASYKSRAGGRLVVRSPGVVTEVVGTLFSVEADGRVSVSRGRVRVRATGAPPVLVDGGRSWRRGAGLCPMPRRARQLLDGFEPRVARAPDLRDKPGSKAVKVLLGRRNAGGAEGRSGATPRSRPSQATGLAKKGAPRRGSDAGISIPAGSVPEAAAVYRQAERALHAGERRRARRLLGELVRQWPRDPLAGMARFELARLALGRGALDEAARQLNVLIAGRRPRSLLAPAAFMRCRVELRRGQTGLAARCLRAFRSLHPRSPHDRAALMTLIRLAKSCDELRVLAGEYRTLYPRRRLPARLLRRCF
jgi:TolA-binding protein